MSGSGTSSASGSTDAESGEVFLEALFGASASDLVERTAGRMMAIRHDPLDRLRPLLGEALPEDPSALQRLAPSYSQRIRIARKAEDGTLAYTEFEAGESATRLFEAGTWSIFDNLEGHFRNILRALRGLCWSYGYPVLGATSRGFLHTRGASVPRHCDELDAIVVQVFGRREWRLEANSDPPVGVWDPVPVPPEDAFDWAAEFGRDSRIVELRPGSVLYVPGAWWHQTRSRGTSYSITFGLPGSAADAEMREQYAR